MRVFGALMIAACLFSGGAAAQTPWKRPARPQPLPPIGQASMQISGAGEYGQTFPLGDLGEIRSIPDVELVAPPGSGARLFSPNEAQQGLHADRVPLLDVLRLIANRHNLNLVVGPGVEGEVTLSLQNTHLEEILDAVTAVTGHAWHRQGNLLFVTALNSESSLRPSARGTVVRVFPLNYIAAVDAQTVANGLVSAAGQVFIAESDSADSAKTRETLIVEDIPEAIERIAVYLAQVDQAPRQVLIEAHILQVVLDNQNRHGVNLKPIASFGSRSITFESLGFANPDAKTGMKISVDGGDITGLVELIQSQTNTRTLASPKLLVTNRQESNIQIGKRLSYLTTTTTQTAAVQTVQFLDTGVVLNVTPVISDDNQILMAIKPKVSGGQLNTETSLPEEESTELATTVLLPSGGGVIIGGLIKDEDIDSFSGVPYLCRLPLIGKLFSRVEKTHIRTEIIIALVAHIQEQPELMRAHEHGEMNIALPPHAHQELTRPTRFQRVHEELIGN